MTISNGLNVSGSGPTEKWDEMIWGEDVWLGPQSIYIQFVKGILNSAGLSDALEKHLFKGIPNGISLADVVSKEVAKQVSNTISANDALAKHLAKGLPNGISLADAVSKLAVKLLGNAIAVSPDLDVKQQKGIWDIVFPGGTTDAAQRSNPVYAEKSKESTTWTSSVAGPATWVES